jgi:diguanylate cyclase (GGDEF)-like protein
VQAIIGTSVRPEKSTDEVVGLTRYTPLERRLWMSAALFASAITSVLAWMLIPVATAYVQAERNVVGIRQYEALLIAANRLSAERGPANSMMSIGPGSDAAAARLAAFRRESDTALAALDAGLDGPPDEYGPPDESVEVGSVAASRVQLLHARLLVDRVASTPAAQRQRNDVAAAIGAMIEAVDLLEPAISIKAGKLAQQEPALAGLTLVAHAVSDLREYAGRIGSYIIPAITKREKLRPDEVDAFNKAVGRLIQIDHMLQAYGNFSPDARLGELAQAAQSVYFDGGLMLVTSLAVEGQQSGNYSMDADTLTARYVPSLKPLEALRRHYIGLMIESVDRKRHDAFVKLALVATAVVALVALLAALLHSLRLTVLAPLLQARDAVVALAEERERPRATIAPTRSGIAEIRSLFDSLGVLSARMDERRALMTELKRQAETDALTALPNRGAFEAFARAAVDAAVPGDCCMFYIDLDDFKIVNDTHGHHVGDTLLTEVAHRLRTVAGEHGFVGRIGGDEFAACCDGLDAEGRRALARSLVDAFGMPFHLGGMDLSIGISVGIAALAPGMAGYEALCQQADLALYQAKFAGRNTYREFGDTAVA